MLRPGYAVIFDCYTDEPSGFGVRPYLGTHQLHLSQALTHKGIEHYYITIDDLRFNERPFTEDVNNTNLAIFNTTTNCNQALSILEGASVIYIIMGCFVEYAYFSSIPPKSDEVYHFLKNNNAKKILFYVLGAPGYISEELSSSKLCEIIDSIEIGNTYRFVNETSSTSINGFIEPDYGLLDKISGCIPTIISQLRYPIIAEIETGSGCNTPFCTYCIEHFKNLKVEYRNPDSIIKQIKTLYDQGIRHFRLGKQPNFYHFQKQDLYKIEKLLSGIRESCSDVEMLHIDNANILNVSNKKGIETTKLIVKYCTSGNIAPLGIESFDDEVRKLNGIRGKAVQALKAIEVINTYGRDRGPDGLPKLLPGINLIYNLEGQTANTHNINQRNLDLILNEGMMTGRLFFRRKTDPTGISFAHIPVHDDNYNEWLGDIITSFVMPMQERVYPKGITIRNHREVVHKEGDSYLRTLGTCPIKVVVKEKILQPYGRYDIMITANLAYKQLEGQLLQTV